MVARDCGSSSLSGRCGRGSPIVTVLFHMGRSDLDLAPHFYEICSGKIKPFSRAD